jgi:hypothetical protein
LALAIQEVDILLVHIELDPCQEMGTPFPQDNQYRKQNLQHWLFQVDMFVEVNHHLLDNVLQLHKEYNSLALQNMAQKYLLHNAEDLAMDLGTCVQMDMASNENDLATNSIPEHRHHKSFLLPHSPILDHTILVKDQNDLSMTFLQDMAHTMSSLFVECNTLWDKAHTQQILPH